MVGRRSSSSGKKKEFATGSFKEMNEPFSSADDFERSLGVVLSGLRQCITVIETTMVRAHQMAKQLETMQRQHQTGPSEEGNAFTQDKRKSASSQRKKTKKNSNCESDLRRRKRNKSSTKKNLDDCESNPSTISTNASGKPNERDKNFVCPVCGEKGHRPYAKYCEVVQLLNTDPSLQMRLKNATQAEKNKSESKSETAGEQNPGSDSSPHTKRDKKAKKRAKMIALAKHVEQLLDDVSNYSTKDVSKLFANMEKCHYEHRRGKKHKDSRSARRDKDKDPRSAHRERSSFSTSESSPEEENHQDSLPPYIPTYAEIAAPYAEIAAPTMAFS
jgi:hypothetical protein